MAGRNKTSVCFAICVMFFICNECQSARINKRQSGNDEHEVPTEISDIIPMVGPEKQVDLGLILDVSKSISKELFYLRSSLIMSTFIRNFVTLHVDYTRLAVVVFDNTARIAINDISSNQGINKCQLFGGTSKSLWLQNITWSGIAGNAVKDALSLTKGIMTIGRVNRPGVTQVTIVLTDGSYSSNDPAGAASELRDDGVTVFTAGLGNWLQTNNVRILGSKDAYFGNEDDWVMLSKGNPSYDPDVQEALGMVNNDLCSGTCNNGMCICYINTGITECQCQAGYTWDGANCISVTDGTYKDTVGNHPATQCPGNMSTPTAGATSITDCFCPSQFLASVCEDQCQPNACTGSKNVCNRLADGNHKCLCPRGYEGSDCNTNTDNCAGMPCENRGTCLDLLDDYMCSCEFGYQGKNCEIDYDECQIGFCENSGVCTDGVPNNFQCTCDIGWKGRYCIDRNEDCDNCQNNGTCAVILEDGLGIITCDCQEQYTGERCESIIEATTVTLSTTTTTTTQVTTTNTATSSTSTHSVVQYLSTTIVSVTAPVIDTTEKYTSVIMDPLTLGLIIGGIVLIVLIVSVTVIVLAVLRHKRVTKDAFDPIPETQRNGEVVDEALEDTDGHPDYIEIASEPEYHEVVSNPYERPDPTGRQQYVNSDVYQGLQEH